MKLLLDENLSPRLLGSLADLYPGSEHVHTVHLGSADDGDVWRFAEAGGFTIVSKDSDFAERSVLKGAPPKVIWLRIGNSPTQEIERILRSGYELVREFLEERDETCLILERMDGMKRAVDRQTS